MIRRLCCIGALVAGVFVASIPTAHAATVSPSKWAPKFCTTLKDWRDTIAQNASDVESSLSNATDLQTARNKLVQLLGDMEDETQNAIDGVKQAGTPSSVNGGKIAALFVKALKTTKAEFATAKHDSSQLSTTDPSAFATDGARIGTNLSQAGSKIGDSFNGVDKLDKGKKLENAVKATRACAFLTSAGSS